MAATLCAPAGCLRPTRPARAAWICSSLGAAGDAAGAEGRTSSLLATLSALRAGWTPQPSQSPPLTTPRCNVQASTPSAFSSEGEEQRRSASDMLRRAALAELPPRAAASPGLLRRRYSVPETVMRRCRLARQRSEPERASTGGRSPSGSPSRGASERSLGARESVRRCALLRRMWGRSPAATTQPTPPCRCGTRSLDGSHSELHSPRTARPSWPSEPRHRTPSPRPESYARTTPTAPSEDRVRSVAESHVLSVESRPGESSTVGDTSDSERDQDPLRDKFPARRHAPYDLLEIAVSETSQGIDSSDLRAVRASPPTPALPSLPSPPRTLVGAAITDRNIDEYVSDILVESLNSLTDRLETITASTEGRMSVIEKEIKVKLQNAGVNTVVHLSPTSNHQIIFGNAELCERGTSAALQRVQSLFRGEQIENQRHATEDCDLQFPPPRSMEANPSSGAGGVSPCTSLVDSLDDPASPRLPLRILSSASNRPGESDTSRADKSESFFVRLKDDECDCEQDSLVVADHMPERIKRRLQRRHRRREKHAEMARRGRSRGARADRGAAAAERACAALVDSLIDDAIGRIAREEYRCARIGRRLQEETSGGASVVRTRNTADKSRLRAERRVASDRPAARFASAPAPAQAPRRDRMPRRLYHKSEIHDGEKCIEILEIVEYANVSRSSSDTTSDECVAAGVKYRKSRIPVPVPDESRRPKRAGAVQPAPPTVATSPVARRASIPSCEGRLRSDSLRFERVFEVIPEERGGLGSESSRSSSGAPPDPSPPRRRSAATSPSAPPGGANPIAERVAADSGRRSIGVQCAKVIEDVSGAVKLNERRYRSTSAGRSDADEAVELTQVPASSEGESVGDGCTPRLVPPRARRPRQARTAHTLRTNDAEDGEDGGWSLTVAGSCRAALPANLEMRVRFPAPTLATRPRPRPPPAPSDCSDTKSQDTEWSSACRRRTARRATRAPRPHRAALLARDSTVYECALGAARRAKRSSDTLPSLSAAPPLAPHRDRQGYGGCCGCCRSPEPSASPRSPHRAQRPAHRRHRGPCPGCSEARAYTGSGVLAVHGAGILPLRKPRAPSMSERDLVRRATPRRAHPRASRARHH